MKLKIKFPFVDWFQDYHEIYVKAEDLNEIFVEKIKSKEIAFDGHYWGLFYINKLPSKKQINKMLLEAGCNPKNE